MLVRDERTPLKRLWSNGRTPFIQKGIGGSTPPGCSVALGSAASFSSSVISSAPDPHGRVPFCILDVILRPKQQVAALPSWDERIEWF